MKNHSSSLTFFLFLSSLLFLLFPPPSSTQSVPSSTPEPTTSPPFGTIQRTTKQQILTSIPPNTYSSPQPFLTSPSHKYTASLVRSPTTASGGGFGNDFCIIRITTTSETTTTTTTTTILWESECAPVSTANTCTLVFDDAGLEVFDGSQSVYNTQADGNHVNTLELLDLGDMRIIDKDGELAWKASDEPRGYQGCGLPGSVGMAPDSPPFAGLIGGGSGSNGPFGQPVGAVGITQMGGQLGPAVGESGGGGGEGLGFGGEMPLVDNSPFDSGSWRRVGISWFGVGLVGVALHIVTGFGI